MLFDCFRYLWAHFGRNFRAMEVIAFLIDHAAVDRIINHFELTFVADKPHRPQFAHQEVLMAADASSEYFP
jgi:hypothetical protein